MQRRSSSTNIKPERKLLRERWDWESTPAKLQQQQLQRRLLSSTKMKMKQPQQQPQQQQRKLRLREIWNEAIRLGSSPRQPKQPKQEARLLKSLQQGQPFESRQQQRQRKPKRNTSDRPVEGLEPLPDAKKQKQKQQEKDQQPPLPTRPIARCLALVDRMSNEGVSNEGVASMLCDDLLLILNYAISSAQKQDQRAVLQAILSKKGIWEMLCTNALNDVSQCIKLLNWACKLVDNARQPVQISKVAVEVEESNSDEDGESADEDIPDYTFQATAKAEEAEEEEEEEEEEESEEANEEVEVEVEEAEERKVEIEEEETVVAEGQVDKGDDSQTLCTKASFLKRLWNTKEFRSRSLSHTDASYLAWLNIHMLPLVYLDENGLVVSHAHRRSVELASFRRRLNASGTSTPIIDGINLVARTRFMERVLESSETQVPVRRSKIPTKSLLKKWFGTAAARAMKANRSSDIAFTNASDLLIEETLLKGDLLKSMRLKQTETSMDDISSSSSASSSSASSDAVFLSLHCRQLAGITLADEVIRRLPLPTTPLAHALHTILTPAGTSSIGIGFALAYLLHVPHMDQETLSPTIARCVPQLTAAVRARVVTASASLAASSINTDEEEEKDIATTAPKSASAIGWQQRQNTLSGERSFRASVALDKLMELVGLEPIKRDFLRLWDYCELQRRRGMDLQRDRFHLRLVGNPGTGKSAVAQLYTLFLVEMGIARDGQLCLNGQTVVDAGAVDGWRKPVKQHLATHTRIAVRLDVAGALDPSVNPAGRSVIVALNEDLEQEPRHLAVIFMGAIKEMDSLFGSNATFQSRVPMRWVFDDYGQAELQQLFQRLLKERNQQFTVEGDFDGKAAQIVIRRLAARRGPDFDNAHAVTALIDQVLRRQASRVQQARLASASAAVAVTSKSSSDLFQLTFDDVVGPNPFTALETSQAYRQLTAMVGLEHVKKEVEQLIHTVRENYERELRLQEKSELQCNRVFLGNPGTGKTTVATLYGQIFCDLGVLSKGDCLLRGASDLLGAALGESERKTNAMLLAAKGCVLVIDEAYSLDPGRNGDPFRKAAVDVIVEKVQPASDADRVVLMLGYKEPMIAMMRNANPGLARRFDWTNPIVFEDFTETQLFVILSNYLARKNLMATNEAMLKALDCLAKKRRLPNFGNAGEVHNLVNSAITRFMTRTRTAPDSPRQLIADDFVNPSAVSNETLEDIFQQMIGCDAIVQRMRALHAVVQRKKTKGLNYIDSQVMNWLFVGGAGTGKSTVAGLMGRVFHALDILASPEVVTISASKLQAGYVGQTTALVRDTFRTALGKVLVIDEAYRLDPAQSPSSFMKEATDEIVNILTEEEFKGKLVVVLAGYTREMHRMLQANQGLASRFPEELTFAPFGVEETSTLLEQLLERKECRLEQPGLIRTAPIQTLIQEMVILPSFANGRDVHTFADRVETCMAVQEDQDACVTSRILIDTLVTFINNARARTNDIPTTPPFAVQRLPAMGEDVRMDAPILDVVINAPSADKQKKERQNDSDGDSTMSSQEEEEGDANEKTRPDPSVSVKVWRKLQQDRKRGMQNAAALDRAIQELQADMGRGNKTPAELARLRKSLGDRQVIRQEAKDVQAKLRTMSRCGGGYDWVRQDKGYRCSYGSCFISDEQLAQKQ